LGTDGSSAERDAVVDRLVDEVDADEQFGQPIFRPEIDDGWFDRAEHDVPDDIIRIESR
jgi:hypothetical protein